MNLKTTLDNLDIRTSAKGKRQLTEKQIEDAEQKIAKGEGIEEEMEEMLLEQINKETELESEESDELIDDQEDEYEEDYSEIADIDDDE